MSSSKRVDEMHTYYAGRMPYYDEGRTGIEEGWVTQPLLDWVTSALAGRNVLEIACGTGLWTGWIAPKAASVTATDYTEGALDVARKKAFPEGKVRFKRADAYLLADVEGQFNGGFHCDWWSHVPKARRVDFLKTYHSRLQPGARVLMCDTLFWASKRDLVDENGDQIQTRKLRDGRHFEVIKNFPSKEELFSDLEPFGTGMEYRTFADCGVKKSGRWCVSYLTK
jgi:SAM-dependent methyltransferase